MILIKKFNQLLEKDFEELSKIDLELIKRFGISFSNEIWDILNFKYKLPKKFDYSFVQFENNVIIGYVVASEKNNAVYIHRFGVSKKDRAKIFFEELLNNYKNKNIYLMVNIINMQAIKFYEQFDFDIVNDNKVIKKFIANELYIKDSQIIIGDDYRCYLMKRD